jgi:hypothetical protein
MKKFQYLLLLSAGLGVTLAATTLFAGAKYSYDVTVDTSNRYAQGSVGSARASNDSYQLIGCYSLAYTDSVSGICAAADRWGTYAMCTVPASAASYMIPAITSVGPQSYVSFSWDSAGFCTVVLVSNYSAWLPPVP